MDHMKIDTPPHTQHAHMHTGTQAQMQKVPVYFSLFLCSPGTLGESTQHEALH